MDSVQALAIAAAAFVTSLSLDGALVTDRFAARAEAIAEHAMARAQFQRAAFNATYAPAPQWRACESRIKTGRL